MSRVSQRKSVRVFRESSNLKAVGLSVLDVALFVTALAAIVGLTNNFAKAIAAVAAGLLIARLFVLGHDACHQSLFANRNANRWVGRLLFLPSLTPYSLWEVGHNLGHHVYTNLRGMDYVWTPLSKAEYDALPAWRRMAERFYRSGYGFGAYYLVELWWRKLFFASRDEIATQRPEFKADSLLTLAFAAIWIGTLVALAHASHQSALTLVLFGFVVPFLVWGWLMGAVIYFHHTHPLLAWYQDIDQWEAARDESSNTVHIKFPFKLGRLLNNIMEHPAHHLDVRIPLYNLEAAHRVLVIPEQVEQRMSTVSARDCISRCKLYDYDTRNWTDFEGRRTSPVLAEPLPASAGSQVSAG